MVATGGVLDLVELTVDRLVDGVVAVIPELLAGLLFLAVAAVAVRLVMVAVRALLRRAFPDQEVYARFVGVVVSALLWFGVALSFLTVVGLGEIAAALGTASGFVALGVAYALSGMIADAVAGVYLLRDPDFEPGDRVTAGETTGVVRSIELRKTRIEVDGDGEAADTGEDGDGVPSGSVEVRANAEIEKHWTRHGE